MVEIVFFVIHLSVPSLYVLPVMVSLHSLYLTDDTHTIDRYLNICSVCLFLYFLYFDIFIFISEIEEPYTTT
jgi:hypothetical protein